MSDKEKTPSAAASTVTPAKKGSPVLMIVLGIVGVIVLLCGGAGLWAYLTFFSTAGVEEDKQEIQPKYDKLNGAIDTILTEAAEEGAFPEECTNDDLKSVLGDKTLKDLERIADEDLLAFSEGNEFVNGSGTEWELLNSFSMKSLKQLDDVTLNGETRAIKNTFKSIEETGYFLVLLEFDKSLPEDSESDLFFEGGYYSGWGMVREFDKPEAPSLCYIDLEVENSEEVEEGTYLLDLIDNFNKELEKYPAK